MANNPNEASSDDFLEQILGFPNFVSADSGLTANDGGLAATASSGSPMMLHLSSGDGSGHISGLGGGVNGGFHGQVFPLGLSLEQSKGGFLKPEDASGSGKRFHEELVDGRTSTFKNISHGQPLPSPVPAAPHPPAMRLGCGLGEDRPQIPHSIAERVSLPENANRTTAKRKNSRKNQALQELVPSVNKTDRAAMLDEIVDYVKFLRLQVKVLSMSRLGGAGAVAPLVTDIPISSVEDESGEGGRNQPAWEKWSNDGTERQVAKLMEENVGAAMQFLQSKALCIMPISLATAIYHSQPPESPNLVKPETSPSL